MNKQEIEKAINSLKNIVEYWTCRPAEVEAVKLAISALEQQLNGGWIPVTGFTVIDTETGQCPDMSNIARFEGWAESLIYYDIGGFAITEDGYLIVLDDCGNMAYCPEGRFKIAPDPYKEVSE